MALSTAAALMLAFGFMGWVSFTAKAPTTMVIHVRRADTGEALPDLEVWSCRENWLSNDFEEDAKKADRPLRTDAQGNLRIDRKSGTQYLFARHEDQVGFLDVLYVYAVLGKFATEATLELTPERSITIRALDQNGKAVSGVLISRSVIFQKSFLSRMKSWWQGKKQIAWSSIGRTSGAESSVTWRDLVYYEQARKWDRKVMTGIRFRAWVPGHEEVSIEVSPLPAHGSTIDLQLPPTGELTIKVLDPRGRPALGKGKLNLHRLVIDKKVDGRGKTYRGRQTYQDGEAHFPAVAPNAVYEVSVKGGYAPIQTKEILGPTDREPKAVRTLILDDDLLLIRGRALNAEGKPFADEYISAQLRIEDHKRGGSGRTGNDGSFLLTLPGYLVDQQPDSAFLRLQKHKLEVNLTPRMSFHRGLLELGDVVFDEGIQLLSGTVNAADGAPCTQKFSLLVQHRSVIGGQWKPLPVRSEIENGSFRVFGKLAAGDYRLLVDPVRRHHIPPEPIAFSPGQENLHVQLERGHTLNVLLHISAEPGRFWQMRQLFRIRLRPTPGSALDQRSTELTRVITRNRSSGYKRDYGELFWDNLATGSYQCEASIQGTSTPFRIICDIQIPGEGGDLTYVEMDLATDLREVHLDFKPIDGSVPTETVRVHLLHENRLIRAIIGSREKVTITVLPGAFDAWILAPGYLPLLIESLATDRDVLLTPSATALSVRLADRVDLPQGVALRVTLEATAEVPPGWQIPKIEGREPFVRGISFSPFHQLEGFWPRRSSTVFDSGSIDQLEVQRPGSQEITLELIPITVKERQRWGSASVLVADFSPKTFDLQPSTETQTLTLQVTQAAIDAALRRARAR